MKAKIKKEYAHYVVTIGNGRCHERRTVEMYCDMDKDNPLQQLVIESLGANFKQARNNIDKWIEEQTKKGWKLYNGGI